ncbi:MAG: FitA-like ribbon-helix-helix domain-containing protein [Candidatus Dormibacteraceae bacterium]
MAVSITVRNVPDEVRNELAARAGRSGNSLQQFLLNQFINMTSRPSMEEVIRRARARVAATGTRLSITDILDDHDSDRR